LVVKNTEKNHLKKLFTVADAARVAGTATTANITAQQLSV
jgi:hypothetical protein